MFERFTDRARLVVVLAQEEARGLDHNYIGTEHLLLGLLREDDGVGRRALQATGLTADTVRAEVEKRIGRGSEPAKGHIPFTPRAKKVLELALRQALQLGHNYIGTEHVLLALLREGEGVAAQILMTEVEGGLETVRDEVTKLLDLPPAVTERLKEGLRVHRSSGAFTTSVVIEDEVRRRLEAIEARLSAIEQLLRQIRGQEEAS